MSGCWLVWVLVLDAFLHVAAADPDPARTTSDLRRALGMIQYVAADYSEAVSDAGSVISEEEFEEQARLLAQAEVLLRGLPRSGRSGLLGEMRALVDACGHHRPPADVVTRARRLHMRIARVFADVQLAPQQVPSLAAGRILYSQACAICHGEDGRAQTPQGRALDPAPRDFTTPEQGERLSPIRPSTPSPSGFRHWNGELRDAGRRGALEHWRSTFWRFVITRVANDDRRGRWTLSFRH